MTIQKAIKGQTHYKTVSHFLYNWLKYSMAPSSQEREWGKCTAASVHSYIHRYCWPEARQLDKDWKKILEIQRQYIIDEKRGVSFDKLASLHLEITTLTHSLIDSFIKIHNAVITADEDEWSEVMTKEKIEDHLAISSYQVNKYLEEGLVRRLGRQRWQYHLSLDKKHGKG